MSRYGEDRFYDPSSYWGEDNDDNYRDDNYEDFYYTDEDGLDRQDYIYEDYPDNWGMGS